MENNENLNNQVNESNNVGEEKKNNNKTIGIVILIIGLLLVGLAVYKLFVEKPDTDKPKDNNTQDKENNNPISEAQDIVELYGENYELTQKVTYKSKDGKNELIIEPQNDTSEREYYAYFNSKKMLASVLKIGKYLLVETDGAIGVGQCSGHTYIINTVDNTLVNLYSNNLFNVVKINNNYYFIEYICADSDIAVYDEKLDKIGTNYLGADKKNYYILNGNIIKYDSNGKEVSRTIELFDSVESSYDNIQENEINGNLFILLRDKNNVFFIDSRDLSVFKVGASDEYSTGGSEAGSLHGENGKVILGLYDLKKSGETVNMYYDIETKKLTK